MMKNNTLYAGMGLGIAVVVLGAVLYFAGYFESIQEVKPETEATAGSEQTEEEIDLSGLGLEVGGTTTKDGYTIERLPLVSGVATFDFDRTVPQSGGQVEGSARVQAVTNQNVLIGNLKANPDNFNAWLSLGVYRLILGDGEGAVLSWEHTAKLYPTAWEPHLNLGNYYRDNGNSTKAKAAYAVALDKARVIGNAELVSGIQAELNLVK